MFAYQERDLYRPREKECSPMQSISERQPIRAQVQSERVGSCQIVTIHWCSYWR